MPFLLPNQQRQSTEGKISRISSEEIWQPYITVLVMVAATAAMVERSCREQLQRLQRLRQRRRART